MRLPPQRSQPPPVVLVMNVISCYEWLCGLRQITSSLWVLVYVSPWSIQWGQEEEDLWGATLTPGPGALSAFLVTISSLPPLSYFERSRFPRYLGKRLSSGEGGWGGGLISKEARSMTAGNLPGALGTERSGELVMWFAGQCQGLANGLDVWDRERN